MSYSSLLPTSCVGQNSRLKLICGKTSCPGGELAAAGDAQVKQPSRQRQKQKGIHGHRQGDAPPDE